MSTLGINILLVEDDGSIRETLADLLVGEGYDVASADSAEMGLRLMQQRRFDLVLTDYALPGETGVSMVASARQSGVLDGTPVLVITAHPQIENPQALEVIRKPLDVDQFLDRVSQLVAPVREKLGERTRGWLKQHTEGSRAVGTRVELVLYISAYSSSSLKALRNVQKLLQRFDSSQVTLTVFDLSKEPVDVGEEDKIAFTPTLVKRRPEPRTWILGDLDNSRVLEDMLTHAGVELSK